MEDEQRVRNRDWMLSPTDLLPPQDLSSGDYLPMAPPALSSHSQSCRCPPLRPFTVSPYAHSEPPLSSLTSDPGTQGDIATAIRMSVEDMIADGEYTTLYCLEDAAMRSSQSIVGRLLQIAMALVEGDEPESVSFSDAFALLSTRIRTPPCENPHS